MAVLLENYTNEGEIEIEKACRVCYQSFHRFDPPTSTAKLIPDVIQKGHFSVLEHAVATFKFTDVSRVMTHELVRHRVMSPSQESQRYVVYADKPETDQPGMKGKARKKTKDYKYITPPDIAEMDDSKMPTKYIKNVLNCTHPDVPVQFTDYDRLINLCYQYYEFLLSKGIRPEDARYVLPNATMCDIVCTANLREWRHIFYLRCHPRAHWEIRSNMNEAKDLLKDKFPNVFFDFPKGELTDKDYESIIIT